MRSQPTKTDSDAPLEPGLARLVEKLTVRLQNGEAVDSRELAQAHPEYADRLRQLLPALRLLAEVSEASRAPAASAAYEVIPGLLGDFRILREVGRGGMGVVYEAEQVSLNRRVALKVLPYAALADARQLQRFKNEARAAASLRHAHIVPVHGVGCDRGIHYFAMQFVDGITLAEFIRTVTTGGSATKDEPTQEYQAGDDAATPVPAATSVQTNLSGRKGKAHFRLVARLIAQAADALECAHATGVVHRDVKPGNLMLDSAGHLWVTDFGLAKLDSTDGMTVSGDFLGTLRYMSPEQALARHGLVDHRTDIYSLGATLYELLTLRPAVEGTDREAILNRIILEEPPAPRRHNKAIPVELETITRKAMAKDPADRYATAAAFADDLRRWLDDQPIRAKPEGRARRIARWVRRRPTHAAVYALTVIVLLLGAASGGATWLWRKAETAYEGEQTARQGEEAERKKAQELFGLEQAARLKLAESERREKRVSYLFRVGLADRAYRDGDALGARLLLDRCDPALRGWEWDYLDRQCRQEVMSLDHGRGLYLVRFSPDGKQLISNDGPLSGKNETKRWDFATGKEIAGQFDDDEFYRWTSPDGKWTARAAGVWNNDRPGVSDAQVKLREEATGREVLLSPHNGFVQSIVFSPDGRFLATGSFSGGVKVWELATRQPVLDETRGHTGQSLGLFYSADGTRLTTAGTDGAVKVWDVAAKKAVASVVLEGAGDKLHGLTFSPDHLRAAGGVGKDIEVWDLATGRVLHTLTGHTQSVNSVLFLPDGRLVSSSHDKTIRVWDLAADKEVRKFVGHAENVMILALHPDGRHVASSSTDGTIKVWDLQKAPQTLSLEGPGGLPTVLAYSPDGRRIAVAGESGWVKVWDPRTGRLVANFWAHPGQIHAVAFGPDGLLATGAWDRTIKLWDLKAGRPVRTLRGHEAGVTQVAFSRDGRRIASASFDGTARVWDVTTGEEKARLRRSDSVPAAVVTGQQKALEQIGDQQFNTVYAVGFTPDGNRLVTATNNKAILWDIDKNDALVAFNDDGAGIRGLDISPDGQLLATTGNDRTTKVWDLSDGGKPRLVIRGHTAWIHRVQFSPDGQRLVTSSADATVKLWDLATGEPALTLAENAQMVTGVAFSPDGRRIASACTDGTVRVWSAAAAPDPPEPAGPSVEFPPPPGYLVLLEGPGSGFIRSLAGDAAGNTVVAGSFANSAKLGETTLTAPAGGETKPGQTTPFVAKLDPGGKVLWVIQPDSPTKRAVPAGVAVDAAGDVYLTGTFNGEFPFGPPGSAKSEGADSFLVKFRGGDGEFLWGHRLGGPGTDAVTTLAVGPGGVFVAGAFDAKSATLFEKQRSDQGGAELTVKKFAADGTAVWTQTVKGTMTVANVKALAVDAAGDVYAAGAFDQAAAFPTGSLTNRSTGRDMFVAKLAGTDGRWVWAKQFPGTADGQVYGVAVAADGPLYLTGGFTGTVEFDSTALSGAGSADGFVARLDPATGAVAWARSFGGVKLDAGSAVRVDSRGRVHVVGTYRNEARFGPATLDHGEYENGFLTTLSPAGDFLDAVSFADESTTTTVAGLHLDAAGNRYVGGVFYGAGEIGFPQRYLKPAKRSTGYLFKLPPTR